MKKTNPLSIPPHYPLRYLHADDLEDFLGQVETSFGIRFEGNELMPFRTFGQLCAHIADKIEGDDTGGCTNQQAFYKLRAALPRTPAPVSPGTPLAALLPRSGRRAGVRQLEAHLGFPLNILRPPHWVSIGLMVLVLVACMGLFIDKSLGMAGLVPAISGLWIANRTGRELSLESVGQLAKQIASTHYMQVRRVPSTFNREEVVRILGEWFYREYGAGCTRETD